MSRSLFFDIAHIYFPIMFFLLNFIVNFEGGSTSAVTTSAPGLCASSPCPFDTTCQELVNNTYTCFCQPGLIYNETYGSCDRAKTFPTDLTFTTWTFEEEMGNMDSDVFINKAGEILVALRKTFNGPDYLGSTVLSLKKGSVIADVENFFRFTSDITDKRVEDYLKHATESGDTILKGAKFTTKGVCSNPQYCDGNTTENCIEVDGVATCTCKEGHIKSEAIQWACLPCPNGHKAVESKTCEECSFGKSGFNCNEPYLLALVVVSCVLSILFLSTFIGAMVLYWRSKKMTKSSEKNTTKSTLEFNKPVGLPRIPRANPNYGCQPTNLEMADSGSRNALVTKDRTGNTSMWDYDDTRSYKSQMSSRTGYGAAGGNNVSKATRNPYYEAYDDRSRRY